MLKTYTPLPLQLRAKGWWDAQNASSITQSGGSVSSWGDSSGNNGPFLQANASFQPTYSTTSFNGLPGITTNGTNQVMISTYAMTTSVTQFTMAVACIRTSTDQFCGFNLSSGGTTGAPLEWRNNTSAVWFQTVSGAGNNILTIGTAPAFSTANAAIFTGVQTTTTKSGTYDDSQSSHFTNSAASTNSLNATVNPYFGQWTPGGVFYRIVMGECMVFDYALTSSQITNLKQYLSQKWMIPLV